VKGTVRCALMLALVCASIGQSVRAESFKTAKLLPVAAGVDSVLMADVNGDHKLDLVYLTADFQTIEVALGKGDGTFAAAQPLPAITQSTVNGGGRFAIADVNNDGKLDVIAVVRTNSFNSALAVFLGNGDGTFGSPIISAGPTNNALFPGLNARMGIADFDGDGAVDIVISDVADDTISFLSGDNAGHFTLKQTFFDGNNPQNITVADLNGDGHPDFIAQGGLAQTISVYIGNGNGTFQPVVSYTGPNHAGAFVLSDIDHDGHPDLVISGFFNTISVLPGHGDGTFSNTPIGGTQYAGGVGAVVAVSDFDGDGTLDIATVSSNGMEIFRGLGSLTYAEPKEYAASSFSTNPAIGDLNGDGHLDFALATSAGVAILFGQAGGTLHSADMYDVEHETVSATVGDFNGDHIPDIAVGFEQISPRILLGNGDGTFTVTTDQNQMTNANGTIVAGDFNGDHKLDLLASNGDAYLFAGNGNGTFAAPTPFSAAGVTASFLVQDLNNDGIPDLYQVGNGSFVAFIAQPDLTYVQHVSPIPQFSVGSFVFGDVNEDGKIDFIVDNLFAVGSTTPEVAIFLGNGDGTFSVGGTFPVGAPSAGGIAVGDVDGDGHLDIIRAAGVGGGAAVQILYGHGDGTFDAAVTVTTPHPVQNVSIGDMNTDGIGDIIVSDSNVVTIINGAANRQLGTPHDFLAGSFPAVPSIVDFDGDGAPDLLFPNVDVNGESTVTVLLNLGASTGALTVSPNPAVYGQQVTLSASFTPKHSNLGVPGGSVSFAVGRAQLGTVPLQNDEAGVIAATLAPVGTLTAKASWTGDDTFNANTLTTPLTITKASTSLSLSASSGNVVVGEKVTLTANVTPQFSGLPSGTVTFQLGTGAASNVNVDATGSAALVVDTSKLALGSYSYTASYSGDGNFSGSSAGSATQFAVTNFHVTASPGAVTVSAGGTGTVNVSVATTTGFNGTVDLTCSGLPTGAQCSFAPASVSLAGASSATSVMTVTGGGAAIVPGIFFMERQAPIGPVALGVVFCALMLAMARVVLAEDRRRNAAVLVRVGAGALFLIAGAAFGGCGGGSGGGGGGGTPTLVTATVQITATVHGSSPAVGRTATVSVTVEQ
jgi:Bacterial Ig-like domain (group 3)/FG-GAP-like repeat